MALYQYLTSKLSSSALYVAVSLCYPWSYIDTNNAYSSVTKEFVVCSHVLLVSICYSPFNSCGLLSNGALIVFEVQWLHSLDCKSLATSK